VSIKGLETVTVKKLSLDAVKQVLNISLVFPTLEFSGLHNTTVVSGKDILNGTGNYTIIVKRKLIIYFKKNSSIYSIFQQRLPLLSFSSSVICQRFKLSLRILPESPSHRQQSSSPHSEMLSLILHSMMESKPV